MTITMKNNILYKCQFVDNYNCQNNESMKIIFFLSAIEHICRIIRILRQERGSALLIGVAGMGKQTLTK